MLNSNLEEYPTPSQRGDAPADHSVYEGEPVEDRRFYSFEDPGDF
jgi:hypothetical protein